MRTKPKTIKLAKIRRHIREAIRWYKVDDGMPEYWTSKNYKKATILDNHFSYICKDGEPGAPYYIRSSRAIEEIAKKIYELVKK